jgi:hypothetical protein
VPCPADASTREVFEEKSSVLEKFMISSSNQENLVFSSGEAGHRKTQNEGAVKRLKTKNPSNSTAYGQRSETNRSFAKAKDSLSPVLGGAETANDMALRFAVFGGSRQRPTVPASLRSRRRLRPGRRDAPGRAAAGSGVKKKCAKAQLSQ